MPAGIVLIQWSQSDEPRGQGAACEALAHFHFVTCPLPLASASSKLSFHLSDSTSSVVDINQTNICLGAKVVVQQLANQAISFQFCKFIK